EGHIVWSNPAFSELSGYSSTESLGRNPRFLSSGRQGADFWISFWKRISAGETWRGELTNRRKDGSLYIEESTVTPVSLSGGPLTHFVAIKQDVSDRKRAEDALRQAEEKYRAMFEDAVVGIFRITERGRPLSIN